MSKLQEKLRKVRVFNNHEFFGDEPFIDWYPRESRALTNSRWVVVKRGENLETHWRLTLLFEPKDIWIGIFFKGQHYEGPTKYTTIYVCLIPMFPLRIELIK